MSKQILLIIIISLATTFCLLAQSDDYFKDDLSPDEVRMVLSAVADRQLETPLVHETAHWANGALYAGMVEWAAIADDGKYYEWLREKGENSGWTYFLHDNPLRRYHADDYCVGQMYIELYRRYNERKMIKPLERYFNRILRDPAEGSLEFVNTDKYWSTQRWSWCDALFMGPTVWAKMANVTGREKYLEFMYREYKATTDYLYDKEEHLFFRDSNYFNRREANGEKVFWGRGNGWVFAGLPIIMRELPAGYENRDFFVTLFREMAAKLVSLQSEDGSWHASLLDPAGYPNPEMSATAFFVFGIAWGINNNLLDSYDYLPSLMKGWSSMVSSLWPDGKVGFVQPIGSDPKAVTREMTEVYGVGGFLLAGTEIIKGINAGKIR